MANKIALVTGGSRGLGKDMAIRLAEAGQDVIITYHSQKEAADAVVTEIEKMGRRAVALVFDSSVITSTKDFVNDVGQTLQTKFKVLKLISA